MFTPSPSDLYPCGANVHIPSLGIKRQKRNSLQKHIDSACSNGNRFSVQQSNAHKSMSRNLLSNLDVNVSFTEDVIQSTCPEAVPYATAKERLLPVGYNKRNVKTSNYRESCYCHSPKQLFNVGEPLNKPNVKLRRPKTYPELPLLNYRQRCSMWNSEDNYAKQEVLAGLKTLYSNKQDDNGTRNLMHCNTRLYNSSTIERSSFFKPVSDVTFTTVLQPSYPGDITEWIGVEESALDSNHDVMKYAKGFQKWVDFPARAPTPTELQWTLQGMDDEVPKATEDAELTNTATHKIRRLKHLLTVVQELMAKWKIFIQPQNLYLNTAMKNLTSSCGSKQLTGLEIIRQLFGIELQNPKYDQGSTSDFNDDVLEVVQKIECLLDAEMERVRVAASIMLWCLKEEEDSMILHVLLTASKSGSYAERWAAVQTLAINNICNVTVVKELFNHLCSSSLSNYKDEKCMKLLSDLSSHSNLVHAVLAEQLNSKSWNEQLTACQVLPLLHGGINKDLCNHLLTMSWNDWHPEVRLAAAQALGKTGNGKLVHDEIQRKLRDNNEYTKLSALKKLHTLHIMTARLLPSFLDCFKDDHISVRLEAIAIAADFKLNNDDVINALIPLLQDSCWKVKAHAIKALGILKITSEEVLSHLLWAARFERLPVVRAQVCNTLSLLNVKEDRIAKVLRDLLTMEEDEVVVREAREALLALGYDTVTTDDMVEAICAQVKSLGTQEVVTEQVMSSQNRRIRGYVLSRPPIGLSNRDYMNSTMRCRYYNTMLTSTQQQKDIQVSHKHN